MQGVDMNKLFSQGRLNPNIAEHKLFIEATLASLAVMNPGDYEKKKEYYDNRIETVVEVSEPVTEPVTETAETIIEEKPKKVGRPPKKRGRPKKSVASSPKE